MLILYQMNRRRFLNPESCTVLISIVFSPTVFLSVRGAMSRCVCVCVGALTGLSLCLRWAAQWSSTVRRATCYWAPPHGRASKIWPGVALNQNASVSPSRLPPQQTPTCTAFGWVCECVRIVLHLFQMSVILFSWQVIHFACHDTTLISPSRSFVFPYSCHSMWKWKILLYQTSSTSREWTSSVAFIMRGSSKCVTG